MSLIKAAILGDNPEVYAVKSVMFEADDQAFLQYISAAPDDNLKFTISTWIKLSSVGLTFPIIGTHSSGSAAYTHFGFNASNQFIWKARDSTSSVKSELKTTAFYRDTNAWYHVLVNYDSAQAVNTDRVSIFMNGVKITDFATATYPTLNRVPNSDWDTDKRVGYMNISSTRYDPRGYLSETYFLDGIIADPSEFTETNATTGQLLPKPYTGLFGSTGFYLNYEDPLDVGKDSSGNANDLVDANGLTTSGDGATQNKMAINILAENTDNTGDVTHGSLRFDCSVGTAAANHYRFGNIKLPKNGKYYFEMEPIKIQRSGGMTITDDYHSSNGRTAGIATVNAGVNWCSYIDGVTGSSEGAIVLGDRGMLAIDTETGKVWAGAAGTWFNSGDPTAGTGYIALISEFIDNAYIRFHGYKNSSVDRVKMDFMPQESQWDHQAPSGFIELEVNSLPNPDIINPGEYVNTMIYDDGSGAKTGLGFSPDFLWFKPRGTTSGFRMYDTTRGATFGIRSQSELAEVEETDTLLSFDVDGFTVGTNNLVDSTTGLGMVAWAWKRSITAGFDIVTWTGNTTVRTISHNLGVAPAVMMIKNRDNANSWRVYRDSTSSPPAEQRLLLDLNNASAVDTTYLNSTPPTTAEFTVGTDDAVNLLDDRFVAYLFAPVDGFFATGAYDGNGTVTGPHIYCGFEPALVMIKRVSGTGSWYVIDNKRSPINKDSVQSLVWEGGTIEAASTTTTSPTIDMVSNGFKLKTTGTAVNGSGEIFFWMAWAETPFKYAGGK